MTTIIFGTTPAYPHFQAIADTQMTAGNTAMRIPDHDSKIINPPHADHLILGISGAVSVKTALMSLNLPSAPKKEMDDYTANIYMSSFVVPAIKAHLNAHFPSGSEFVHDPLFGILINLRGTNHVFMLTHDLALIQRADGFYAVGSGSDSAQASFDLRPDAPMSDHMQYAAEVDLFTSGPFQSVS